MSAPPGSPVPPPLHELEAELMDLVWESGETTVRSALEALNAHAAKPRAYTTIMTTMARLHAKGLLDRRRERRTDIYAPRLTREQYRQARAAADIETLVSQYGDVALVGFAREMNELDPKQRERLRRLARRDQS